MAQDKIFLLLVLILLLDTHHDCAGGQKAKKEPATLGCEAAKKQSELEDLVTCVISLNSRTSVSAHFCW